MTRTLSLLLLALAACGGPSDPDKACDASLDSDQDGIDDCRELELGLDMNAADTDNDGFADAEELDCVSDPADPNEVCYACGWEHNDPGTLEATGDEVGDTMRNIKLVDQCGEKVSVWDFTGEYHILYLTAAW